MEEALIVVALAREGAEALAAVAADGLDADDAEGQRALAALRNVLESEAEAELRVLGRGLDALAVVFDEYPEFIVRDSDGVGLLSADQYRHLFDLFALLRGEYEDATKKEDEDGST